MDLLRDNLLWFLLLLPLVGALACVMARAELAKTIALLISLGCVVLVLPLLYYFQYNIPDLQFPTSLGEIETIGFGFNLGIDGISLWLVLLTVFLQPLVIAASFQSIREREKEYYAWMLVLLAAMLGVFTARDMLLFYVFFELTLVPMFFIIGIWGGPQRRYAAVKFFLFTFSGSIFALAAILYVGARHYKSTVAPSFDMYTLIAFARDSLSRREMFWVLLGLLIGFAVKVPLFPLHTWLPLAHTEAPTAGSVILAGVLLKLGTYGILRLAMPIGLIHASADVPVLFPMVLKIVAVLCIIGIIYAALVAWVQYDIKKLVAYSSVSHLGFCVLGLMALNFPGVQGSVLYMVNHGLSTGALFLVVGMIYDRYHTRDIRDLSGLGRKMPILSFFLGLFALSSIGLPGLNGFVSEFLTILGAFTSPHLGIGFGAFAAVGVILGAVYILYMVARILFGPLRIPAHAAEHPADQADQGQSATPGHPPAPSALGEDLGPREIGLLIPIALAVVFLGVFPRPVLDTLHRPVQQLIEKPQPRPPDPPDASRLDPPHLRSARPA